MLLVFGRLHKGFSMARWSEAIRYQGTSFLNWTLSATGTILIDRTANKWDNRNITNDERSVIMGQLRTMVPPKTLQKFSSANEVWNYNRLANIEFLTLIGDILEDEYFWPDIWYKFNGTLPRHNKYNHESWKANSLEVNRQVPKHYREVISISEHKKILKKQAISFYNARSRTQKFIQHLKCEFQENNEENARQLKLLQNDMHRKLQNQNEMMGRISWEAQQSQYDLCMVEIELKYTQNLLNQKCMEITYSSNRSLQNEITNLQDKLSESEMNLQAKINEYNDKDLMVNMLPNMK